MSWIFMASPPARRDRTTGDARAATHEIYAGQSRKGSAQFRDPALEETAVGGVARERQGLLVEGAGFGAAAEATEQVGADCGQDVVAGQRAPRRQRLDAVQRRGRAVDHR